MRGIPADEIERDTGDDQRWALSLILLSFHTTKGRDRGRFDAMGIFLGQLNSMCPSMRASRLRKSRSRIGISARLGRREPPNGRKKGKPDWTRVVK